MEIRKTLYITQRKDWRAWLSKHHKIEKDIWLIYYTKASGKSRLSYNDSVEEALCFGWIDSIVKKIDKDSFAQRYTPRKKNSPLSELNKERIRFLIKQKKMTKAGLDAVKNYISDIHEDKEPKVPADILSALKQDKTTWENYKKFPKSYKRIRIFWIEAARIRPEVFEQRLRYFIKMTAKNKMFGMVR